MSERMINKRMLMRLDGEDMVVSFRDSAKLLGISVISCCAVIVCTLFVTYYLDVIMLEDQITSGRARIFYEAQVSTAKAVCFISGGCLLATSVVMLFFYIRHYIDTHKKQLGILKAMGYTEWKIARHFWVFGSSVFLGTAAGFGGAFLLMPEFYEMQNKDRILPEIVMHFHPAAAVFFVLLPTVVFSMLAVCYARIRLKMPVRMLLLGQDWKCGIRRRRRKALGAGKERSFLEERKRTTLRSKKSLVFFIVFASFCFSAMTQMSFSMKDLSSEMMGIMMFCIGIILACVTLFLAITTVINGNTRTIALMRVSGYTQRECCHALLGGYRPLSYIGFALGTVYQYLLLRIMVDIVFKGVKGVPEYRFDLPMMMVSLLVFLLFYETVMYVYTEKMKKVPVRELMSE